MAKVEDVMDELKEIFGDRVRTRYNELVLYSHDQAFLPSAADMMIDTMPEAVVMPATIEELEKLMDLANEHKVPLTPRGGATAAVMGAVPVYGGIVVDFKLMNEVLDIDKENLTVTVEPGIVWQDLEDALNKEGLTLRIFVSSTPSAQVGGWIAMGGIGLGSLEYGNINQQIESLDVLTPKGLMKDLYGTEVDLVADCLGVTGFMTQVTIKVKPLEKVVPFAATFPTHTRMCKCLEKIRKDIPVWNLGYESPDFVEWKQKATGHRVLPKRWLVMATMPEGRYEEHKDKLAKYVKSCGGEVHPQKIAEEEWEGRFYPLRMSKFAPSLVPGEVYVPADRLQEMIEKVMDMPEEPLVFEGTYASPDACTMLAFVFDDERRSGYLASWGFTFRFIDLARGMGGRGYQIGGFLPHLADEHFGDARWNEIKNFKYNIDPNNIMNPGKLYDTSWKPFPLLMMNSGMLFGKIPIEMMSSVSAVVTPYKVPPIKKGQSVTPDNKAKGVNVWELYACIQCGYCTTVCPVFEVMDWESHSPRGRVYTMKAILERLGQAKTPDGVKDFDFKFDEDFVKSTYCTLCYHCEATCMVGIKFSKMWEAIKEWVTYDQGIQQPEMARTMYKFVHDKTIRNPFGEPLEKRDEWEKEDHPVKEKADVVYFKGCSASYYEYKTLLNILKILKKSEVDFTTLGQEEMCCGAPLEMAGLTDKQKKIAKHNIKAVKKKGAKLVITACPGCLRAWRHYEHHMKMPFKVMHVVEFVNELVKAGKLTYRKEFKKGPVIYHDPCELSRIGELEGNLCYEPPRELLQSIPGMQLLEFDKNRRDAQCCGGGGIMKAIDLGVSQKIGLKKVDEAIEKGAAQLVSSCPSCNMQFGVLVNIKKDEFKAKGEKLKLKVADVLDLVAKAV
jgi:Fe-S oxidoreductase/FAD/FMN-containing dehydrogenase